MDLIGLLVQLVIVGLIAYVIFWGIGAIGLPEPFNKICIAIIVLIVVVFLVNLLSGMSGHTLLWPHRIGR